MEEKRCYGCMKLYDSGPVCPHCGFDENTRNASHQIPIGTVLQAKYRIGRVLGQGGFGITYLGWDEYLDVPVAVKEYYPSGMVMRDNTHSLSVVSSSGANGDKFRNDRERFLREAKSLARFKNDPQIVTVSNFFLENNTAYIVMEYVQGITLKQHIKRSGGKLSPEETFRLLGDVMLALDRVHQTGLVHRDISPDNIMLLPGGGVKLIDFGAVRDVRNAEANSPLSKSTESILKQGYAPIEQYQKRGALGPWTDVYALCATIYYCLTGEVPPDAPARVLGEEEFSWEAVPGLSRSQKNALDKGMAMVPRMRTQSMQQLHRALLEEAPPAPVPVPEPDPEEPIQDPDPEPRPPKWRLPVLVTAAVLAIVCTAGLLWNRDQPREEPEQLREPLAQTETAPEAALPETTPAATEPLPEPWEKNVMRPFVRYRTNYEFGFICDSDIDVTQIEEVTFLDTLEQAPYSGWDVSEAGDGSVMAWIDGYDNKCHLYIAAEGGINGKNACKSLFGNYKNLKTIHFNGNFHTRQTEDFSSMFANCHALEALDLSTIDTRSATTMSCMFLDCRSLTQLDVSGLDTSNVTDMMGMFWQCAGLTSLDLRNFDTSEVTEMAAMFEGCSSLRELDLRSFDTANVVSMTQMFHKCSELENLDASSFDGSSVKYLSRMLLNCPKLRNVNMGSFAPVNAVSYEYFMDSSRTVNDRPWRELFTKKAPQAAAWEDNVLKDFTSFSYGHQYTEAIADSDIEVTKIVSATFLDTLADAPASAWDVSEAGDGSVLAWVNGDGQRYDLFIAGEGGVNGRIACKELFNGYKNLKKVDFGGNFHTEQAADFSCMFADCRALEELDITTLDTSNATTLWAMFNNCRALKTIDLSHMDTAKVTDMGSMFSVTGLERLDLSGFDTGNVISMEGMFSYSEKLEALDLSSFDTANVTVMEHMFYHCTALEVLDVSSFDTSNVIDMTGMFRECTKLKDPDLSHFDVSRVTKYEFFMEQGKTVNGRPWAYLFSK